MYYFIAKPSEGKKAKLMKALRARLDEAGVSYRFDVTQRKGEERELAERYSQEENAVIVAVGGDGMLNGVLSGLRDPSRCVLGVIPAGTGNDFAAAAWIPYGEKALDLILAGASKPTDYIEFSDGKRSMNIAGMGIDVDILVRCDRKKRFRAKSKYFLSLLSSLLHYRGSRMTIRANGESYAGNFLIAAICNGSRFGGGIPICPPAVIDDGKLEIVYADCPSRIKIPFALIKLMKGKILDLPFAHRITCEAAEFEAEPPITAQYDGELFAAEKFSAKVGKGLKMFRG